VAVTVDALEDTNRPTCWPGRTLAGSVYPATSPGFGGTVTAQSSVPGLPGSPSSADNVVVLDDEGLCGLAGS